jgi:glyoxylase I family protein
MAGFRVLGFNHTNFTVSDLDRAIGFFRDLLGFEVLSVAPRDPALMERMTGLPRPELMIAFVKGPGHVVELIEYRTPADRGRVQGRLCDAGSSHLALDVDDIVAAVAGARAWGFAPVGDIIEIDAGPNRGSRVVYVRDGDGVTIEFIQKPGGHG